MKGLKVADEWSLRNRGMPVLGDLSFDGIAIPPEPAAVFDLVPALGPRDLCRNRTNLQNHTVGVLAEHEQHLAHDLLRPPAAPAFAVHHDVDLLQQPAGTVQFVGDDTCDGHTLMKGAG